MIPLIKKLLCDAIRSGTYKQNKGYLRGPDQTFCVMGVLCELYRNNIHNAPQWTQIGNGATYGGRFITLPSEIEIWSGLEFDKLPNPVMGTTEPMRASLALSHLNDTGYSFEDLAVFIENHL